TATDITRTSVDSVSKRDSAPSPTKPSSARGPLQNQLLCRLAPAAAERGSRVVRSEHGCTTFTTVVLLCSPDISQQLEWRRNQEPSRSTAQRWSSPCVVRDTSIKPSRRTLR
ncbi:unnamed protein product, partial [Scytosiphon promiscuus]